MPIIGLVQADAIVHNKQANFQRLEKLLKEKIRSEIDLIVFPEMFCCGFSPEVLKDAENTNGESVSFLKTISTDYDCDVVATVPILDNNLLFNRLFWISKGTISGTYDKHKLFFGEEEFFTEGYSKTFVKTLGYKFLPLICFEVRFPEWCRNAIKNSTFDYDCLLFLTNFPAPRENELLTLACARAIENQAFVIVTNRVGVDGYNKRYSGGCVIINPKGEIIASNSTTSEEIVIHSCDFSQINLQREAFPIAKLW